MIIYASPNTGKTTFCNNNPEWIDTDVVLFQMLKEAFGIEIKDDKTKGQQIIDLFKSDRVKAESVYTQLYHWLKENRSKNILLGTRRFMFLADKILIKRSNSQEILKQELKSINKWKLFDKVNYINDFIELKNLKK